MANPVTQITKDQHFVPSFYLKQFAAKDLLQVLNVRKKRMGKARPYTSVCYRPFFYGAQTGVQDDISQAYEGLFGTIETYFGGRLPGILSRARTRALDVEDFDAIASYMTMQWMRTDKFRRNIQRMESEMLKHVMAFSVHSPNFDERLREIIESAGRQATDETVEEVRAFFAKGEYELQTNNASHLHFIGRDSHQGFRNLLFAKKWTILSAGGDARFITSDNPVSEWVPFYGLYGASFVQRTHFFPLVPDLLVKIEDPGEMPGIDATPEESVEYVATTDDETLMYDMVIAGHCDAYAYAGRRYELEELIRQALVPGDAFRMYAVKYYLEPRNTTGAQYMERQKRADGEGRSS